MKKIDLGQTIGIFANVGVIAGIIFLAIELRQNNQLLQAEAIGTALETRIERQDIQLNNPHLVALIVKNRKGQPLTDEERHTVGKLHARGLLGWQKDFFLFQQGILDEDYLRANIPVMKRTFRRKGQTYGRIEHWNTSWRHVASPEFREFIEQCVIADCEAIPR